MTAIVVPFRGPEAKSRLPQEVRRPLALAMLADVLAACAAAGPTTLASGDEEARALAVEAGAGFADDPGGGQAAAVAAALAPAGDEPAVVVNADLPCAVPRDVRTLVEVAEAEALGVVEAPDGTTNALALPRASLFAPLYGPGSAERFLAHGRAAGLDVVSLVVPNLADDVDTLADLSRVGLRAGPHTQAALAAVS
jgi:2-phospho-L-lactate guanylyltransferase